MLVSGGGADRAPDLSQNCDRCTVIPGRLDEANPESRDSQARNCAPSFDAIASLWNDDIVGGRSVRCSQLELLQLAVKRGAADAERFCGGRDVAARAQQRSLQHTA